MTEFFEGFYMLKPVLPLMLWNYLILVGLAIAIWLAHLVAARQSGANWISVGSKVFAKNFWQVIVLDRTSTRLIDLYISLMIISTITRTAVFIAYLPTIASVAVMGIIWGSWAIIITAAITALVKSLYRRRRMKDALEQQHTENGG